MRPEEDQRAFAPATERNREPILEVLETCLPKTGTVLEIASGTGQHARFFSEKLPHLTFQPSDPDPRARRSIAAWRALDPTPPNLLPPLDLDMTKASALEPVAAVLSINMIHIAPIEAAEGLFRLGGAALSAGAPLVTYGPYQRDGRHTSESNDAFDRSLRSRDPRWGIRDVAELEAFAATHGFARPEVHPMPANNFTLVFRKAAS
ncbi:MAG: DUF938 domain-containing protein [Myxococcota bacterium]